MRYVKLDSVVYGWLNEKWKLVDGVAMIDYTGGIQESRDDEFLWRYEELKVKGGITNER